jgi:hypothetical protein
MGGPKHERKPMKLNVDRSAMQSICCFDDIGKLFSFQELPD